MIRPGKYKHFKGGIYNVHCVAIDAETDTAYVVYHSIEKPESIFVRRESNFVQQLPAEDGTFVPRFLYIDE